MGRTGRRAARGFTLIEVVMASAVLGIVVLGLSSALMMAGRAASTAQGPGAGVVDASEGLGLLASDLSEATSFRTIGSDEIGMIVPDRTRDGEPEEIVYAWAGSSGDPLTRTVNGAKSAVVASLREFSISHETVDRVSGTHTISGTLALESETRAQTAGSPIGATTFSGISILPTFADDVSAWSVSGLGFWARATTLISLGDIAVEVWRRGADGLPTTDLLAIGVLPSSSIGLTYRWVEVTFTGVPPLDRDEGVCFVLRPRSGLPIVEMGIITGTAPKDGHKGLLSVDGGASWSAYSTAVVPREVYGRLITAHTANDLFVTRVGIEAALGDTLGERLRLGGRIHSGSGEGTP